MYFLQKFIFYLTKVKETAEDFWQECGNLPGVYPGKIKGIAFDVMSNLTWKSQMTDLPYFLYFHVAYIFLLVDVIPTEGLVLKNWVRQTFGIQVSVDGSKNCFLENYVSIEKFGTKLNSDK